MQSHEMALNDGKTLKTFKQKRKIVKAVYKLIYWPKKICDASVEVPQVPSQVFIFSECLFSSKLLIVWKIVFSSFSLDYKQEI